MDDTQISGGRSFWLAMAGLCVALITAFGGAVVAPTLHYYGQKSEVQAKMIEIAIGVLRAPPNEDISAIREWAIDIIDRQSDRPLTALQKNALLHHPLLFGDAYSFDGPADRSGLGSAIPMSFFSKQVTSQLQSLNERVEKLEKSTAR